MFILKCMNNEWTYRPKSEKQLYDWYKSKVKKKKSDFESYEDFKGWYNSQSKVCYYCGLTEEESQMIIHKGFLISKRFPINGIFKLGTNRGYWLEVDKKDPRQNYSKDNCELSCYFCNNDKSDVFNVHQYQEFKKDRIGFLKNLLK